MSCMSPRAPARLIALGSPCDSTLMIARTSCGETPLRDDAAATIRPSAAESIVCGPFGMKPPAPHP